MLRGIAVALSLVALTFPRPAFAADYSQPGPFAVGETTVTVPRSDGTLFGALVFYPATTSGTGTPVSTAGGPFPPIVFGHGYLTSPKLYADTLRHLASWGCVVLAPESGLELFPSHAAFAADYRDSLDFLATANADAQSVWLGRLRMDRCGFSGHSMGGGCSVLAAADEGPRLKVVANLAAAETRPSAIEAASRVTAPQVFLAGSQDGIAPLRKHTGPIYESARPVKQLLVLQGGSHCGFLDAPIPGVCDSGDLPRAEQLAITRRNLTAVFLLYLSEQDDIWPEVWGTTPQPKVIRRDDSGIALAAMPPRGSGPAGQTVTYQVSVTNRLPRPQELTLAVDQSDYPATVLPTATGVLMPGAATTVEVKVQLPAGARRPGTTHISARSGDDGHTRQTAVATTTVSGQR